MTKIIHLFLAVALVFQLHAQEIQPLEDIEGHYKTLNALSASPNPERASLDEISYPMEGRATGQQFIGLEPTFLSRTDVTTLIDLKVFPANSSDQTRAELDFLLEWQEKRTSAQRSRALEIAPIGYWPPLMKGSTSYGSVEDLYWECEDVGNLDCNPDKYPNTTRLLAGVTRDARIMEFTIKYHLKRARPYHLELRLKPMARVPNPSFASGHTLWAYVQAFTWSELLPDRRQDFLAAAYDVGESREIMGIHYPSDEEAARVIAHQMLVLMLDNEAFIEALREAKKEWN